MVDIKAEWFSTRLLEWYIINKRHLPWRDTKDPFKVWLSEIILQQTRVNQGLPYYLKFTESFNTVEDFASAKLDEILKLWQGLGYYSRARNMHQCANDVVEHYGGNFPNNYSELQKLKGIGKYTAAAIASICFNEPVPTVDGNVFRVLSRLFGITDDIAQASSFKVFFKKASELIPIHNPGDFNQAMMEFGATVCTPKSPDCDNCIFANHCMAQKHEMIPLLPVKSKKVKIKHRYFNYNVITYQEEVLIRKREAGDIWTGLFEFDLEEAKKSSKYSNFENAKLQYSSAEVIHQLTHQKLHIKFNVFEMYDEDAYKKFGSKKEMASVSIDRLRDYAVPKPIEMFLNEMFCK